MKIREDLARKYNYPVPRYTSYPPANKFTGGVDDKEYLSLIEKSNHWDPSNVSFYVHIPFCKKMCFYCGCNSFRAKDHKTVTEYFNALLTEIGMVTDKIDRSRKISQIHFGGGTPNSVPVSLLKSVIDRLSLNHQFIERPEIAIECHPALLDRNYIEELKGAGFNRFSLGIQDFDNNVLKMVNRDPASDSVENLIAMIKSDSDIAVNLDFIYGLPGQTPESFANTIRAAAAIRPDRLVTFSYAHVPWVNKNQTKLEKHGLPDTIQKLKMFENSHHIMVDAGYKAVGLDHFVLEGDELDIASSTANLHRNFQGYSTLRTTGQVYAFGSSGISQLDRAYIQNCKTPEQYISTLQSGTLPVEKGHLLTGNEIYVKQAIDNLMCNKTINLKSYSAGLKERFGTEPDMALLNEFENVGIITIDKDLLYVTEDGLIFIRNVAAAIDPMFAGYTKTFSNPV